MEILWDILDLCRMRAVGYTSTKLLSVHVRDASTWSLSHGIRCSSAGAGGYQTVLHYCGCPLLDWGGELPVFIVRPHAPNREVRTVTVRYEYMYHPYHDVIFIFIFQKKKKNLFVLVFQILYFRFSHVGHFGTQPFFKFCCKSCIL